MTDNPHLKEFVQAGIKADPIKLHAWSAALRSGEYDQIKEALHTDRGYCCLGVMCEIAGIPVTSTYDGRYHYDNKSTFPSNSSFTTALGVITPESKDPEDYFDRVFGWLAQANDERATFDEIADAIDEVAGQQ